MNETPQHTAMVTLVSQLREIASNSPAAASNPNKGRETAVRCLSAIIDSLRAAGADADEQMPFLDLLGGIADIMEGRDSWLNKNSPKPDHRPTMDRTRESKLGIACAVVTVFVNEGDAVEAACRNVSSVLSKSGIKFGKTGSEEKSAWQSLKDYRQRLMRSQAAEGKMKVARETYDQALAIVNTPFPNTQPPTPEILEIPSKREIADQWMKTILRS